MKEIKVFKVFQNGQRFPSDGDYAIVNGDPYLLWFVGTTVQPGAYVWADGEFQNWTQVPEDAETFQAEAGQ